MRNGMSNFKGYRSHPVYMEKVSNFLLDIQPSGGDDAAIVPPPSSQAQDEQQQSHNPYTQAVSFNAPQQQQQQFGRIPTFQGPQSSLHQQGAVSGNAQYAPMAPVQQAAAPAAQEKRAVRSSDLRNKRKNLQTGQSGQNSVASSVSATPSLAPMTPSTFVQQPSTAPLAQAQNGLPSLGKPSAYAAQFQQPQQQNLNMYGKKQGSYSVKLALDSGGFMADSY